MMWLIKFLQKRPQDKTILIGRSIFWLLYIGIMYYNLIFLDKWIDSEYLFGSIILSQSSIEIAKYIMISIWIIPLFMGITNICLLKKKHVKMIQIFFWILIFYVAGSISESPNLDFDIIIGFMWFLPLFAGISWKCITSKCLKYKEKITKIRV